jgi:hypothetical protein
MLGRAERQVNELLRIGPISNPVSNEEAPSGGSLRFWPELGQRLVGIALLGAVELRDFREMNFGDTNFLIADARTQVQQPSPDFHRGGIQ